MLGYTEFHVTRNFFFLFAFFAWKYRVMVWSVRLVFISQSTERVEITFKTGSHRTRKVIRGMQFLFVFFQYDFLLYLSVFSFLNKQSVGQRNCRLTLYMFLIWFHNFAMKLSSVWSWFNDVQKKNTVLAVYTVHRWVYICSILILNPL